MNFYGKALRARRLCSLDYQMSSCMCQVITRMQNTERPPKQPVCYAVAVVSTAISLHQYMCYKHQVAVQQACLSYRCSTYRKRMHPHLSACRCQPGSLQAFMRDLSSAISDAYSTVGGYMGTHASETSRKR